MTVLNLLTEEPPPNYPAAASLFSQLAGVLAGFAFTGLITLVSTQLTSKRPTGKVLESGVPLLAAFVTLVLCSLNYAFVAAETPGRPRIATLQTSAGLGLCVASVMLLYSMLILIRGLEHDSPKSREISHTLGNTIRFVIVVIFPPLTVLLMWSGAHDHVLQKYGPDTGFRGLDWAVLAAATQTTATAIIFSRKFFKWKQHHPDLTRRVSTLSIVLATISILVTNFTGNVVRGEMTVSDLVLLGAVLLTDGFVLVVAYSASRFTMR
ncbi:MULTISPECIES: hypothetical protein [Actinosynnema]|uniref:hypothetical protein n=1 Tax=Actinosynnema TaxID=40566 RepID=UPI0020A38AD3|nr:hypothetical protein [Actinosynnema pretiosum]MCP2096315.1 hypothetical protein [Actinosynnema pretiosum]